MPIDKEHILKEIKRTAAENGGQPPGRQAFLRETGIRESDWLGIHWVRWSEALSEAGFSANSFQTAYDKKELLKKYAEFASELGRLPVDAELKLRTRTNSDFPSNKTFQSRFSTKQNLVSELAQYCKEIQQFDTVIHLCEAYSSTHRDKDSLESKVDGDCEIGFVYLMRSGRFYKIGHSNSAGRREYELAIQLPEKLKTIHTIRTDDPVGIEAYWHNRFKDSRQNGEWFDLSAADISAFKRRKFM